MAVESEILILFMGMLFSIAVYQKNRFFGNIGGLTVGIALMYWGTTTAAASPHVPMSIGLVILLGSLLNGIVDLMTPEQPKNKRM